MPGSQVLAFIAFRDWLIHSLAKIENPFTVGTARVEQFGYMCARGMELAQMLRMKLSVIWLANQQIYISNIFVRTCVFSTMYLN